MGQVRRERNELRITVGIAVYTGREARIQEVATMVEITTKKVAILQENGHQVVVLPADIRFDGDEVFVSRDDATGRVILSAQSSHRA